MNLLSYATEYLENNLFEVIGALLTISGVVIALIQWNMSIRTNRAKYVKDLLVRVLDDPEIQKFQNIFDYSDDWYNEAFHRDPDSDIPKIADRTMFTYNYICYLFDAKEINKNELEIFKYHLLSLAHEDCLEYYFLDLFQHSMLNEKVFPFTHYLKFCEDNNCISKSIRDKEFFFYWMCNESKNNGNDISEQISDDLQSLINKSRNHLFIKTVPLCKYCSNYDCCQKIKEKNKNETDEYPLWAGVNNCDMFNFMTDKWRSDYPNNL